MLYPSKRHSKFLLISLYDKVFILTTLKGAAWRRTYLIGSTWVASPYFKPFPLVPISSDAADFILVQVGDWRDVMNICDLRPPHIGTL